MCGRKERLLLAKWFIEWNDGAMDMNINQGGGC